MKTCPTCLIEKPFSEFYKCKPKKDGYSRCCKLCDNARNAQRQKSPQAKSTRRKWVEANREALAAYQKSYQPEYFQEHREEYKARNNKWREANSERSKELQRNHFQKPKRKLKHKINQAFRRVRQQKATFKGYEAQIRDIYEKCPPGYHVDHIVPLRGKDVCGLHVPWNLQYLPALENIRKNNKVIL